MNIEDPRLLVIPSRLAGVRHVIPVMSSKGGVGKTLISTGLALYHADKGLRVGLLDLDVSNPTAHMVLGVDPRTVEIKEDKGVIPPIAKGVRFMTISFFTWEQPTPLRGWWAKDAIREILAITRWGELDILYIDTPPGLGDEALEALMTMPSPKPLVVTTPSPLSRLSTKRLVKFLADEGYHIAGGVFNMDRGESPVEFPGLRLLGRIRYDPAVDHCIGDPVCLRRTVFWRDLGIVGDALLEVLGPGDAAGL